jgi:hypothetical protein
MRTGREDEGGRRGRAIASADGDLLGAVAGGVWGWLYMTEAGRRVRDQIEPKLDDFVNELTRVRGTVDKGALGRQ